jgi:hypothetical protein
MDPSLGSRIEATSGIETSPGRTCAGTSGPRSMLAPLFFIISVPIIIYSRLI